MKITIGWIGQFRYGCDRAPVSENASRKCGSSNRIFFFTVVDSISKSFRGAVDTFPAFAVRGTAAALLCFVVSFARLEFPLAIGLFSAVVDFVSLVEYYS